MGKQLIIKRIILFSEKVLKSSEPEKDAFPKTKQKLLMLDQLVRFLKVDYAEKYMSCVVIDNENCYTLIQWCIGIVEVAFQKLRRELRDRKILRKKKRIKTRIPYDISFFWP